MQVFPRLSRECIYPASSFLNYRVYNSFVNTFCSVSEQTTTESAVLNQHVLEQFAQDPQKCAKELASKLNDRQRTVLLSELAKHYSSHADTRADQLYKSVEIANGSLSRGEFGEILAAHDVLKRVENIDPPKYATLQLLMITSALPFLAFGFLDNFIMLSAGEEIDALIGAKFAMSTLASAGFGNMIADVVGVSAAKVIEQNMRRLPLSVVPKLSASQHHLPSVKYAKSLGATVGVACGCLLGLLPLYISGHFFHLPE